MKKLALVWGENRGGRPLVILPLAEVTEEKFKEFTERLGAPKGRTETIKLEEEE